MGPTPSRLLRRCVVWLVLTCLLVTQSAAQSRAHAEGLAAGLAANPMVRSTITTPGASAIVPGYTSSPAERAYADRPDLSGPANNRLTACALTPGDPVCQALQGAQASARIPRDPVSPSDPAVAAVRRITAHPGATLEDIASYYGGCQPDTRVAPAETTRICHRYDGTTPVRCTRSLSVSVAQGPNCPAGGWFAQASASRTTLAVQCRPDLPVSQQHVRLTSGSEAPLFLDLNLATTAVFPQWVLPLPAEPPGPAGEPTGLWIVDNACDDARCQLTAFVAQATRRVCPESDNGGAPCREALPFLQVYAACPNSMQSGDRIALPLGEDAGTRFLDPARCYAPASQATDIVGGDSTGTFSARFWTEQSSREVAGYRLNPAYGPIPRMDLEFARARSTIDTTDHWDDGCATATSDDRCTVAAAARCVEGPATKEIGGVRVTRACWRYETALYCRTGAPADECAPLAASGCTPLDAVCRQAHPSTGTCALTESRFRCPAPPSTEVRAHRCPANVFCLGESCFNTSHPPDADFARTMTFLEAARQAGVYLDRDRLEVFRGEPNRCRDRLLQNCCTTDQAGAGMSNQSLFGVGSRLVYDVLMNAGNRAFVAEGMGALLMNGGFSGSFTSYGVTVAVNGTALPAGSSVLYAGESMVVAFDPWSLVIAVVLYVVMSMLSCDEEEGRLAMKEGAQLCHAVGTYCSSCIRVLGRCVSCITHTTNKCCFNSVLARIINEQGREQLNKGWGTARDPDCAGFTIAELERLDFARMDLRAFYAAIVPTVPDIGAVQGAAASRANACYHGAGRCP